MSNPVSSISSFDARLKSAEQSSVRFKEAASTMGGILTSLGNKIRKTGIGVTLAGMTAFLANTALVTSPAQAQQATLTSQQCEDAVKIAGGVVHRYRGQLSPGLVESFVQFSKSNCDLNTDWKLANKSDEQAFGEFRVHLIAMRKQASAGTATLVAKN